MHPSSKGKSEDDGKRQRERSVYRKVVVRTPSARDVLLLTVRIPLFYVSVSGLLVIIDLLKTPRRHMHSTETEQKIQEVTSALDQMR